MNWLEELIEEYNKTAKEEDKLTRYRLEKDYGLSQKTTHNIIKNNTQFDKISINTAYALAKAVGMELGEFVEKYREK